MAIVKSLLVYLLNLLLPGAGFVFMSPHGAVQQQPCNTHLPDSSVSTAPYKSSLLYSVIYLVFLLSFFVLISWSGVIFQEYGLYYLFFAYLLTAVVSTFHLFYYRKKCLIHAKALLVAVTSKVKVASVFTQCSFPITYLLLLVALLANKETLLGWQVFHIPSNSMYPFLHVGDVVLADTRPETLKNITQSDVVVFTRNKQIDASARHHSLLKKNSVFYIKRIIGIEGDKVEVINYQLRVNDAVIHTDLSMQYLPSQKVIKHGLYVVGDNVNHSSDSRMWGQLPSDNVVGKFTRVLYRNK